MAGGSNDDNTVLKKDVITSKYMLLYYSATISPY